MKTGCHEPGNNIEAGDDGAVKHSLLEQEFSDGNGDRSGGAGIGNHQRMCRGDADSSRNLLCLIVQECGGEFSIPCITRFQRPDVAFCRGENEERAFIADCFKINPVNKQSKGIVDVPKAGIMKGGVCNRNIKTGRRLNG